MKKGNTKKCVGSSSRNIYVVYCESGKNPIFFSINHACIEKRKGGGVE
jgi:hypothetical protein